MKKLILILALMFCLIFSFNTLAFEKVDVTMVNCGTAVEYVLKIQTFIDHGLGTSTTVVAYEEGDPILQIWGTCDSVDGGTNAIPFYVSSILTGEGAVGRAAEFVLAPTCIRMGSWGNAIKAKLDLSGSGVLGSIGLLAGVCAEVVTPAGQLWGSIAVVEHEIVATEGLVLGHFLYSANTLTFLQFALSGNGAAVTEVDNHGQFFTLNGVTPLAGNMLSLGYVTLKGSINDTKQIYLVMSRIEDGLAMGAPAAEALVLAAASPRFRLFTTSAATTGTVYSSVIQQTLTVGGTALYNEVLRVQLVGSVCQGASSAVIFAQINYGEAGFAQGEGAVVVAEIDFPSVTSPVRGEHVWFKAEINVPTACDLSSTRVAIIGGNVWGGGATEFDDNGLLLHIDGVTSTASGFYYLADLTVTKADGLIKVRIDDIDYYMFITTAINGGD